MKRTIRLVSCFIAVIIITAVFSCCGDDKNNPVVIKLDKYSVHLDEYRYFYLNYARDLSDSGDYSEEKVRKNTEDALRGVYALYKMADKYNVKLSADEKKAISEQVDNIAGAFSDNEFDSQMRDNYITENVLRGILEQESLEISLRQTVYAEVNNIIDSTDAAVEKDIAENFIRVKHILIKTINPDEYVEEGQLHTGHEDREAEKIINDIASRIAAGEDFDSLVAKYNEDIGMNSENGYYITRGEFLESFEEAAFSLDIGETSGIVKSANGYHIIKRYEQDPEYINDYFEELRNVYKARKFNELRDKTAAELKLKTTETYAGINKEFLMASFDSFSG